VGYDGVKKNMEEHMVEVRLLLLLDHPQVHLPLLLLLCLDQVGVLQPLANQLLSSTPCVACHTQMYVLSPAQLYAYVRSKATSLNRPLTNTLDVTPDKVKDAERLCIWCHPMEKVLGVIYKSALISTFAINALPEHPI